MGPEAIVEVSSIDEFRKLTVGCATLIVAIYNSSSGAFLMLLRRIEEAVKRRKSEGRSIGLAKIDFDRSGDVAKELNVDHSPALLIIKLGKTSRIDPSVPISDAQIEKFLS